MSDETGDDWLDLYGGILSRFDVATYAVTTAQLPGAQLGINGLAINSATATVRCISFVKMNEVSVT